MANEPDGEAGVSAVLGHAAEAREEMPDAPAIEGDSQARVLDGRSSDRTGTGTDEPSLAVGNTTVQDVYEDVSASALRHAVQYGQSLEEEPETPAALETSKEASDQTTQMQTKLGSVLMGGGSASDSDAKANELHVLDASSMSDQGEKQSALPTHSKAADGPVASLSEAAMAAHCLQKDALERDTSALKPDTPLRFPHHRSSQASSIASNVTVASAQPEPTRIHGVVLVGFNHSLGPIVDYSYPPHLQEDEDIAKSLPFLALPDGAHMVRVTQKGSV